MILYIYILHRCFKTGTMSCDDIAWVAAAQKLEGTTGHRYRPPFWLVVSNSCLFFFSHFLNDFTCFLL